MNPFAVAAIADQTGKQIENGNAERIIKAGQQPMKWLMIGIAVIALIYFGGKWYKKAKEAADKAKFNDVNKEKDPKGAFAKTYANRINAAFSWYNDDEKALYKIGDEMKANGVSFALVAQAYKSGFNKDLAATLSERLNADELQTFYLHAGLAGLNGFFDAFNILKPKSTTIQNTDYYA